MDKRIEEIRERYDDKGLTEDDYDRLTRADIAQMRVDCKRLLRVIAQRDAAIAAEAARLAGVERERDAAVTDLARMARAYRDCGGCKRRDLVNDDCPNLYIPRGNCWQWRGPAAVGCGEGVGR